MMKKYSRRLDSATLVYTVFSSPLGPMGLAATAAGLCRLAHHLSGEAEFVDWIKNTLHPQPTKNPKAFAAIRRQLQLYFAGKLKKFDFPLDLSLGTPFQRRTWKKLLAIPYGKTHSYQWLAKAAGNPGAWRATGNANGKNPISIIVPCHRVVRSHGGLGGYTGGLHIKRFLLDLEKASYGTA